MVKVLYGLLYGLVLEKYIMSKKKTKKKKMTKQIISPYQRHSFVSF